MADLPTYFGDFLSNIRLTDEQRQELQAAHTEIREQMKKDERLSKIVETTFLQGSYRRATIVRPQAGKNADVDIIVVTNLDPDSYDPPEKALDEFEDFLKSHYRGKWRPQGRSLGISLSHVDLDLVVTARPPEELKSLMLSEAFRSSDDLVTLFNEHSDLLFELKTVQLAAQQSETLWIPDREAGAWEETNPVAQLLWTWEKNARTNKHFVNVVKALKWWRRYQSPESKHPKSYPLEHLIGDCCPDGIRSVAEGVTLTLEEVAEKFEIDVRNGQTPTCLHDRGVNQDVFKRVSPEDFAEFYEQACEAASLAREALDEENTRASVHLWRGLFGPEFPPPAESDDDGGSTKGGFSSRSEPTIITDSGRFG